ncbi:M48 family metalloprotease [Pontibacter sp. CAU 1760]
MAPRIPHLLFVFLFLLGSCKRNDGLIFTAQDDIKLGQQIAAEAEATFRAEGKLLERTSSKTPIIVAYQSVDRIMGRILASGELKYERTFPWDITLVHDDATRSAFTTPGGHLFIYTGLIKFIKEEKQLAGLLAHEMAHADKRHYAKLVQQNVAVSLLLAASIGKAPATLHDLTSMLTGQMKGLSYNREAETEADHFSVVYLDRTGSYACDGAGSFFELMQQDTEPLSFSSYLYTHQNYNRTQQLHEAALQKGCTTRTSPASDFDNLQKALLQL